MGDILTAAEIEKIEKTPLLFIMGKGRSGTTLLQVMLNAHPNIIAPPESKFIMLLYRRYGRIHKWTEKHIESYCNDLFKETLFKEHWNIKREELKDSLMQAKDRLNYPLLCKLVFYHYAPKGKDVKIFIDKNPLYYFFLREIDKMFPETTYLHIVRDYRANIESHKRITSFNPSTADMAYRWVMINKCIEVAKNKDTQKWFLQKYEDLVKDTNSSMKKVCDFLGMPFDEKMTQSHTTKLYPSFYQHQDAMKLKKFHEKLFQPISTSYIDSWKDKMSQSDLAIAESIAGQFGLQHYGYTMYSGANKAGINVLSIIKVKVRYKVLSGLFRNALLYKRTSVIRRLISSIVKSGA